MDTNWCTFCGKHIDGSEDALYCSLVCSQSDTSGSQPSPMLGLMPSFEYFSLTSPMASSLAVSPVSLVGQQPFQPRDRSPSLTPMTALDLSTRHPCHAPAYSRMPSPSPSSSSQFYRSPSLGPSAFDARSVRGTSVPLTHQLSTIS
ncbi:hypothetical protein J3B02_006015 [Coemansia erecta]|uniref:Uncharacterized protein n=1 Tax=Coemansia asiatica TaxID=1052880 RepID=A0A9W7XQM0_9FUNG|nr:hypothetical protein LPJ64_000549 [Coemansia asiatica]KAJ2841173.1 hypothetical protein J3B02_006015 [Coemansia erecta]KAJ2868575.1 hypothetical protein FB639_004864 [Coemansia asiatica]